jgi:hypothetical protein
MTSGKVSALQRGFSKRFSTGAKPAKAGLIDVPAQAGRLFPIDE